MVIGLSIKDIINENQSWQVELLNGGLGQELYSGDSLVMFSVRQTSDSPRKDGQDKKDTLTLYKD